MGKRDIARELLQGKKSITSHQTLNSDNPILVLLTLFTGSEFQHEAVITHDTSFFVTTQLDLLNFISKLEIKEFKLLLKIKASVVSRLFAKNPQLQDATVASIVASNMANGSQIISVSATTKARDAFNLLLNENKTAIAIVDSQNAFIGNLSCNDFGLDKLDKLDSSLADYLGNQYHKNGTCSIDSTLEEVVEKVV